MVLDLLLDTSALIDIERGGRVDLPDGATWGVSAMTLAELNHGVLVAPGMRERQRRLRTYEAAASSIVLPFDDIVARTYAEIVAWSESEGQRPTVADAIIAATAATNGLTLITLDSGFRRLEGFEGLDVRIFD